MDFRFREQGLMPRSNIMMMRSAPLGGATRREMEKEMIREEIRVAEIFRRRELEAEVRREMALERDLVFQPLDRFSAPSPPSMRFAPRVPILHHRPVEFRYKEMRHMIPFQRDAEIAKVEKVMILNKPTVSNGVGTKRKFGAIGEASNHRPTGVSNKITPQTEWFCALCQVSATCEQGLNDHFEGKKHKKKEAEIRGNQIAVKDVRSNSDSQPNRSNKRIIHVKLAGASSKLRNPSKKLRKDKGKRKFQFWCNACGIGCHSEIVLNNHKVGKKHIENIGSSTTQKVESKVEEETERVMKTADEKVDGGEKTPEPTQQVLTESPENKLKDHTANLNTSSQAGGNLQVSTSVISL
ncbi:hypothetical protein GIB67_026307 [Kingdonia uniflora]|uniref:U1-type domain-containing protein n=1 Tax=Kingdonia uniflora TaxID=39325 RepID=A0A7J7N5I2_9MAGN|nr:hypothetical protein GIB67_026307 [Kingdonia uniflora]